MSECSYPDLGTVEYNGVTMRVQDVPDATFRQMLGYGHVFASSRPVVDGDFPHTPDTCDCDNHGGKWNADGTILYCEGCGLDCT